jgi:hypothetical protein
VNPADQIALRLAQTDPLTWSQEGLDDACLFCDADKRRKRPGRTSTYFAIHASDCLWVEACRYTGTDLGAHGVAE